jgi:hypothetical protein
MFFFLFCAFIAYIIFRLVQKPITFENLPRKYTSENLEKEEFDYIVVKNEKKMKFYPKLKKILLLLFFLKTKNK